MTTLQTALIVATEANRRRAAEAADLARVEAANDVSGDSVDGPAGRTGRPRLVARLIPRGAAPANAR